MAKKIKDETTSKETMHIDEIQVITTDPGSTLQLHLVGNRRPHSQFEVWLKS